MIASWLAGTDPMTVATLAAVMLLEDIRKVPAGSVVLQRTLAGPWRASTVERKAIAILSWWSPLSTAVVVPSAECRVPSADSRSPSASRAPAEHWRAVRWHGRLLALLGAGVTLAVILGLPILSARFGAAGFLAAAAAILLLCAATGLTGYAALRRLGQGRRAAALRGLALSSPFGAPGAYRELLETVAREEAPVRVAQWLMRPADFAAWVRPRAWDALNGGEDAELEAVLGREELRMIAAGAPAVRDGSAVALCQRCGATWRMVGECPDCSVEMVLVDEMAGKRERGRAGGG